MIDIFVEFAKAYMVAGLTSMLWTMPLINHYTEPTEFWSKRLPLIALSFIMWPMVLVVWRNSAKDDLK